MLKKIIQILLIIILFCVIALVAIFVFNPGNLKTKIISHGINSFLKNTLDDYDYQNTENTTSQNSEKNNSCAKKNR